MQAEGSWCGLASLAIVLRALQPTGKAPSQQALFSGFVQPGAIVPFGSLRHGLSMEQLLALGQAVGAQMHLPAAVTPVWGVLEPASEAGGSGAVDHPNGTADLSSDLSSPADPSGAVGGFADPFTRRLARALREAEASGRYLLANLKRWLPSEKAAPTAHWSPLAGFAERPGSGEPYALLLDVAAPAIGPHWLPLRLLAACMCTANMHGAPRGYLSIEPLPVSVSGLRII